MEAGPVYLRQVLKRKTFLQAYIYFLKCFLGLKVHLQNFFKQDAVEGLFAEATTEIEAFWENTENRFPLRGTVRLRTEKKDL